MGLSRLFLECLGSLFLPAILLIGLAGGAAAQPDPVSTPDPRDLCARMPSETGETRRPGIQRHELFPGGPVAVCTIELLDDAHRNVAIHLVGFTEARACAALRSARARILAGGSGGSSMIESPIDLPAAEATTFRNPPSGFDFDTRMILACRGTYLVLGTVGVGSKAGGDREMKLLEERVRATLAGLEPVGGSRLASIGEITKSLPKSFLDRFGSLEEFGRAWTKARRELDKSLEAAPEEFPDHVQNAEIREWVALSTLEFPGGGSAFPMLSASLPILDKLSVAGRRDPRARRALGRYVDMLVLMDASTPGSP